MNKKMLKVVVMVCLLLTMSILLLQMINVKAEEVSYKYAQDLLGTILEKENLNEILLYNRSDIAVEELLESYDEMKELMELDEAVDVIIDAYSTYDFEQQYETDQRLFKDLNCVDENMLDETLKKIISDEELMVNVEKDIKKYAQVNFFETIMTSKVFIDKCTEKEIQKLKEVAYDVHKEKQTSELYKELNNDFYGLAIYNKTAKKLGVSNVKSGKATVKTPKGSAVEVIVNKYKGDEWSNLQTTIHKKNWPLTKVLAKADNRYNCHSYAWYKQSTANKYWMNNPIKYMTDGSYKRLSGDTKGNKVTWVFFNGPAIDKVEHSGIVKKVEGKVVTIESKWGMGPLVQHNIKVSPYTGSNIYYSKN